MSLKRSLYPMLALSLVGWLFAGVGGMAAVGLGWIVYLLWRHSEADRIDWAKPVQADPTMRTHLTPLSTSTSPAAVPDKPLTDLERSAFDRLVANFGSDVVQRNAGADNL